MPRVRRYIHAVRAVGCVVSVDGASRSTLNSLGDTTPSRKPASGAKSALPLVSVIYSFDSNRYFSTLPTF
jgi:hypothetical protein